MSLVGKIEKWDDFPMDSTKYIVHLNSQKMFMHIANEQLNYMQYMNEEEWQSYVAGSFADLVADQVKKELIENFKNNPPLLNNQKNLGHFSEKIMSNAKINKAKFKTNVGAPDDLYLKLPALFNHKESCPVKDCSESKIASALRSIIIHLNDYHLWDRERVADWLETLDVDLTIGEKNV